MSEQHCKDCRFHEANGEGRNGAGDPVPVGVCLRYPPQAMVNGNFSSPVVGSNTSWCGEFSPATITKEATPTRKRKP